jgi:hypothetical protein
MEQLPALLELQGIVHQREVAEQAAVSRSLRIFNNFLELISSRETRFNFAGNRGLIESNWSSEEYRVFDVLFRQAVEKHTDALGMTDWDGVADSVKTGSERIIGIGSTQWQATRNEMQELQHQLDVLEAKSNTAREAEKRLLEAQEAHMGTVRLLAKTGGLEGFELLDIMERLGNCKEDVDQLIVARAHIFRCRKARDGAREDIALTEQRIGREQQGVQTGAFSPVEMEEHEEYSRRVNFLLEAVEQLHARVSAGYAAVWQDAGQNAQAWKEAHVGGLPGAGPAGGARGKLASAMSFSGGSPSRSAPKSRFFDDDERFDKPAF